MIPWKKSEREKGLMIAQLSHDIKTPIASIQATVEGILDGVIKEGEQDHYLATIGRQTERLNKLVEELNFLTLNTARNQVETTSKDSIFLDQLLIECMSEFQFLIEQEERDVPFAGNSQSLPGLREIMPNFLVSW